jgi:hypothetical protein
MKIHTKEKDAQSLNATIFLCVIAALSLSGGVETATARDNRPGTTLQRCNCNCTYKNSEGLFVFGYNVSRDVPDCSSMGGKAWTCTGVGDKKDHQGFLEYCQSSGTVNPTRPGKPGGTLPTTPIPPPMGR